MKKTAYTMMALMVLVGAMAVAAQAQSISNSQVRVSIPFQFHVGDATLPAGDYLIRQLNTDASAAALQISRKDGSAGAVVNMIAANRNQSETSELTFRRYGNQYYFAEVWIDGVKDGLQARKSKAERATQNELAALNVSMEMIAVKLR